MGNPLRADNTHQQENIKKSPHSCSANGVLNIHRANRSQGAVSFFAKLYRADWKTNILPPSMQA
jgi:hypothetical protein